MAKSVVLLVLICSSLKRNVTRQSDRLTFAVRLWFTKQGVIILQFLRKDVNGCILISDVYDSDQKASLSSGRF